MTSGLIPRCVPFLAAAIDGLFPFAALPTGINCTLFHADTASSAGCRRRRRCTQRTVLTGAIDARKKRAEAAQLSSQQQQAMHNEDCAKCLYTESYSPSEYLFLGISLSFRNHPGCSCHQPTMVAREWFWCSWKSVRPYPPINQP